MNALFHTIGHIVLIGAGATAVMDLWLLLLKRMGVPTLNFALVGRWAGHLVRGRWKHDAIAKAAPIRAEQALGWSIHYATGVLFSGLLIAIAGGGWLGNPSYLPALAVGIGTVLAPWLVMQPAMGAGIASWRTATPFRNGLRSLANHAVFGSGLYLAAVFIAWISR